MRHLPLLSALALLAGVATASAEGYVTDSECCGPLHYSVSPKGYFSGSYPKQNGLVAGNMDASGGVGGIWTQPRSDHPCTTARSGTNAWGRFYIRNVATRGMTGTWGYCDERPNRNWGFR